MPASQIFFTIVVPFGLFMIMAGLGLTLSVKDIVRVIVMPKAVLIGLAGQLLLLPLLAFALVEIFSPPPVIAIGLILLAACPGGITSNGYVFASRGDVALSVTMTTISSMVVVVSMPLLTYLALTLYSGDGLIVELPVLDVMQKLALLTLLPIALGMITRHLWPVFADKMVEPVRKIAIAILIMVIVGNTIASFDTIVENFLAAGVVSLLLNLIAMSSGYAAARFFRLPPGQVISITYEVGVQNISLVLTLAMAILAVPDYAVTALVYGLFMKITALSFMAFCGRILNESNRETAG
ncbi:MAG: bile acid:sodium symporter family protein [Gammaproteobacteria bacterium]